MINHIKQFFYFSAIPEYAEESFKEYYIRSDRLMLVLIFLQWFVSSFITSLTYNTYLYGFTGGALITATLLLAYHYFKGTQAMRILVGIAMMLFSLIYIQQQLGRIEMHFHVFIAMGLLTVYKDFIPIIAAAATTILHHLIFNYLQLYDASLFGMPVIIFNYGCGIDIVFLHTIFVVLEALALSYIVKIQVEHSIALYLSEKEILELNAELKHRSLHDSLTGLPNRNNLEQQIEYITKNTNRHKNKFAVLFLDLDHFKNINDTLGHDIGDDLLISITKKLQPALRKNDLISRIGGDEFIIILVDIINQNDVAYIVQKILTIFHDDLVIQGHTLRISASIGISIYPDDSRKISELMKFSDMAMYKAKKQGRDNFRFFTTALDHQIHEHVNLIKDIQLGIERDEFKLFYQPKINIKTGKIIGAEALIRWQHPTKGLIFPDKFIGLAENTGLIFKLGPLVIKNAAKMIKKLNHFKYRDIIISVNVSSQQFQKGELYEDLKQALSNNNINAKQFAIEITESMMMEYVDHTLKILDKIKKLNITICIDDFGTGYSSLAYLKKFPIDSLKIDKTFIDDIEEYGDNNSLLLNTIIAMANSLNLSIIAEGVEQQYQIDYLEQQECYFYQGYFFSKAVSEDEFITLLNKTNTNSSIGLK